jgi:hypothetical protein
MTRAAARKLRKDRRREAGESLPLWPGADSKPGVPFYFLALLI